MRRTIQKALGALLLALLLGGLGGCKVQYSFTGASISPDVKTVSVAHFPNIAPLVTAGFSAQFTEALKRRFMTQTSLGVVEANGDLQFSGEIVDYSVTPTAIQGNEMAAMNRLTIAARVVYTNLKDKEANFERTFSAYEDFPSDQSVTQVEGDLLPKIIEKLVDDIFNASVANW